MHLMVVSSIFFTKKNANGMPAPSTSIAKIIIIVLGETGVAEPLGFMMTLVLPTLMRAASSFSSRF